jgi:HD-GYP domain-containing protein (c-di-GMP phosphodiesterase class II)
LPWSARIVAVAEVFDAMTSAHFRRALPKEAALERISGLRGGQLDPSCVDALIAALKPRRETVAVSPRR